MLSVCILTVACDVSDVRRLAAAARHRLQSEYDIFDGSLSAVPAASGGALNPSSRYLYVSVDRTSTPHVLCDVIDAEVRKNCVQHPALCNATVCGSSFTLAPTDTLTWLGCTPPPAGYPPPAHPIFFQNLGFLCSTFDFSQASVFYDVEFPH